MIPAQLLQDRANIANLSDYLVSELRRNRSERAGLEEQWIRNARNYRARPEKEVQDFPWKGAANIVVPVVATDVDTTVAGLMGALWASPNLWTTEALRPDMIDFAARLQEFLQWAQDSELKMYDVVVEWLTELVLQGTGILKQRYMREQKKMFEWREQPGGLLQQMVRRLAVDRPDIRRVALPDFYLPITASGIQEAPWCAERLGLTWHQLESRVRAGIYLPETMSRLGWHWRQSQVKTQYGSFDDAMMELQNFTPSFGDRFELFEFWTSYDIDRDGEPEQLVCTIHEPSQTYVRIDFNPFFSQEKPYSAARFIRLPGMFHGLGLGDILEMFQDEASAMHRQRLDNGTIRNTAIFKGRKGSGVKANEPIWPGRTLLMEDPEKDLIAMNMGFAADSTLGEEQFLLEYAQRRSGVSDYQRGGAGAPNISYSTATTTIEMLRQGRLRLDQVMREIQVALSETGVRAVELYQQFNQGPKPFMVMGQREGQQVQQVLQFPLDIIRMGVMIRTTATNAQLNKETQVRTNQILMGLVNGTYQQMFQAMQVVFNPQLPPPMRMLGLQMIMGGLVLTRRTLDAYNVQDVDRILPDPEFINALGAQLGLQPTPQYGGAPVPQGFGPASGVPAGPTGYPGALAPAAAQPFGLHQFAGGVSVPGQVLGV